VAEVIDNFKRFDATLRYKVDDSVVRQMGWNGDVFLKLKYAYEQNSVSNWAIDNMQQYMYYAANARGQAVYMAGDNPSDMAQYVVASVAFRW
jgi:hypothetical protein